MLKGATESETHQIKAIKLVSATKKFAKSLTKIKKNWKSYQNTGLSRQYWEIKIAFCYISRYQNALGKVRHLDISQEAPNQSFPMGNTKSFSEKLIKPEELIKYKK